MTIILLTAVGVFLLLGYISQVIPHRFCRSMEKDLARMQMPKKRLIKQIKMKFETSRSFGLWDGHMEESARMVVRNAMNQYRLMGWSLFEAERVWTVFAALCLIPGIAGFLLERFPPVDMEMPEISWEILLPAGILSVLLLSLSDRFFENTERRKMLESEIAERLLENSAQDLKKRREAENAEKNLETEGERKVRRNRKRKEEKEPKKEPEPENQRPNEDPDVIVLEEKDENEEVFRHRTRRGGENEELIDEMIDYFLE